MAKRQLLWSLSLDRYPGPVGEQGHSAWGEILVPWVLNSRAMAQSPTVQPPACQEFSSLLCMPLPVAPDSANRKRPVWAQCPHTANLQAGSGQQLVAGQRTEEKVARRSEVGQAGARKKAGVQCCPAGGLGLWWAALALCCSDFLLTWTVLPQAPDPSHMCRSLPPTLLAPCHLSLAWHGAGGRQLGFGNCPGVCHRTDLPVLPGRQSPWLAWDPDSLGQGLQGLCS